MDITDDLPEKIRTASEELLTKEWGHEVTLKSIDILRNSGRNRVIRFEVTSPFNDAPKTIVVKASVGEDEHIYNPAVDQDHSTAWRFFNEWASTKFLNGLDANPPFSTKLLAGDRAKGIIVLQDFGEGDSLATHMQGNDRRALESALFVYTRTLARMHAATVGRETEYKAIRHDISGNEIENIEKLGKMAENLLKLAPVLVELGIEVSVGASAEARDIDSILDNPGQFLAFSAADMCPDNQRLVDNDSMLVYDFEFAGFHNALLDAAYLLVPWPTCWCANCMPDDLTTRLIEAYRFEIATSIPDAVDDAIFWPQIIACCGYWIFETLQWNLKYALEADSDWGIASIRQRHIQRLQHFTELADSRKLWPATSLFASQLAAKLQQLWPDVQPMPLYPPFL